MLGDRWMIEAPDDFIQKTSDQEALADFCRNAAGAKVKELVFFDLAGRGTMGATDVVGEDFQTRHRIRFGVITQEEVANLLIRIREMSVRLYSDQSTENGAGSIV